MEFVVDKLAADRKQKWFRRDERSRALAFIEGLRRALHLAPSCALDRAIALFAETEDHNHRVVVDAALRVLEQRAPPLARGKVGAVALRVVRVVLGVGADLDNRRRLPGNGVSGPKGLFPLFFIARLGKTCRIR